MALSNRDLPKPTFAVRVGIVAFSGFLACQLLSGVRPVLIKHFGQGAMIVGSLALVASWVLGLIVPLLLARTRPLLCGPAQVWVYVNLVILGLLFGYGYFVREHSFFAACKDVFSFLLAIGFLVIGGHRRFWQLVSSRLVVVFLLGLAFNVYGMIGFRELLDVAGESARVGRDTLAYGVQNILDFWPVLLLLVPYLNAWQRWVVAFGVVFVLGEQLFFQKRIETVFVGVILFAYWFIWESKACRLETLCCRRERRVILPIGLISAGAVLVAVFAAPSVVVGQIGNLLQRFQGSAQGQEGYSQGFLSVFTAENERARITIDCFSGFSIGEWCIGRGMGGAFPWNGSDLRLLETTRAEEIYARYYLPDVNYLGRRGFETGIAMPMLKGGVLLTLSFYAIYIVAVLRMPLLLKDRFSLTCFVFSFVWLGYTLMGGNFTQAVSLQMFAMYAPLGWCLSRFNSRDDLPTYRTRLGKEGRGRLAPIGRNRQVPRSGRPLQSGGASVLPTLSSVTTPKS